jgi:hypothetical protein
MSKKKHVEYLKKYSRLSNVRFFLIIHKILVSGPDPGSKAPKINSRESIGTGTVTYFKSTTCVSVCFIETLWLRPIRKIHPLLPLLLSRMSLQLTVGIHVAAAAAGATATSLGRRGLLGPKRLGAARPTTRQRGHRQQHAITCSQKNFKYSG